MVQLLKAYEEYKYTDAFWLKRIPKMWKQRKAREIFIERRSKVSDKDYVINNRSDKKGSSGISPYDGSVSLICIVLKPITGENSAYLHYLLRSVSFTEEFYKNGKGQESS